MLLVSFVLLGALWRRPLLGKHRDGRATGERISAVVLGPLRIVVQAVSVALFVLVWVSALLGDTDPFKNLVGAGWTKEHWFATRDERDRALKEMSGRYVYFRPGDQPSLEFETIDK